MKAKIYTLLLLIFSSTNLWSQDTTKVFYDELRIKVLETDSSWVKVIEKFKSPKGYMLQERLKNGTIISTIPYSDTTYSVRHGTWYKFRNDGSLIEEINCVNNSFHGKWQKFFKNGTLAVYAQYENNNLIKEFFFKEDGTASDVNLFNSSLGVPDNWNSIIIENVQYPIDAKRKRITGRVLVQIVVDKNGEIINSKIISTPLGGGLEEEALRVVKLLPKLRPAYYDGETFQQNATLPINFSLD